MMIDQEYENYYLRRIAEISANAEKRAADLAIQVTALNRQVAELTAENDELKRTTTEMAMRGFMAGSALAPEEPKMEVDA